MLPGPAALGSISRVLEIVNVAEVNQQFCSEESGQRLENVDRTHLVRVSGNLVLQKIIVETFVQTRILE